MSDKISRDRLKQRRQELKMTFEDVGNLVGVGKSTARKWETGDIENMKIDKLTSLAKALKISPMWLMGYDVPMEEKTFEYNPNEPVEIIIPLDNEKKPIPEELASCIELAKQILNLPEDKKILIKQLTSDFAEMQKNKKDNS